MIIVVGLILCATLLVASFMGQSNPTPARTKLKKENKPS